MDKRECGVHVCIYNYFLLIDLNCELGLLRTDCVLFTVIRRLCLR